MNGLRLAARSALTAPGISLFVVLVVALVALGGAAAPALLADARAGTMRAALEDLPAASRDLSGSVRGLAEPGPGSAATAAQLGDLAPVWGKPLGTVDDVREGLPEPLRHSVGDARMIIALDPQSAVRTDGVASPLNRLMVTFDPRYADRVRFVQGGAPDDTDAPGPVPGADPGPDGPPARTLELALSRSSADALNWAVGESRTVVYPTGNVWTMMLSGIYEPIDAADGEWTHLPTALRPDPVLGTSGDITFYASGYAAPGRLRVVLDLPDAAVTTAWLPFSADRAATDDAAQIAAQTRGAVGDEYPIDIVLNNQFASPLVLASSAPAAIDAGIARIAAMTAVVSLVAVGPLAVAVVALALTGRMLATRRVRAVRLAQARGASSWLLLGLLAAEGLILGAGGAVVGTAAAAAVVGWAGVWSVVVPMVAAITPAVVLPIITVSAAHRTARADLGQPRGSAGRRRLALEIAVILGAAGTVWLTVTRRDASGGVDPLLLLLPLALAAAGSVLALRLVPLALALVEARSPRRRDLVSLVGPARARRDPAVRAAPVLAVVVGVAIALFSVSFAATVRTGIDASAEVQVGADVRVAAPYLSAATLDRLAGLDGVRAVAPLYLQEREEIRNAGRRIPVIVFVVDSAQLADVQADMDSAFPVSDALTEASAGRLPAIASAGLVADTGGADLQLGDDTVDVVATAASAAPLGTADRWLIVDRAVADGAVRAADTPTVALLAVTPGTSAESVADAAQAVVGPSGSTSTVQRVAERADRDPALTTVRIALVASIAIVAALLGLAVGMTLVLGAASRGRMLALLTALGYPRRRELPLVVWEVAPALLAALPLGIAVGFAMPYLVVPALDLTRFVGGDAQPAVELGGALPWAVVAGFVVVGASATAIAAVAASRITAATTLRSLDEEAG